MATVLTEEVPTAAFRRAFEAHDLDGVLAICSNDVTLRSPVSNSVSFRGHSNVRNALSALFATLEDIQYVADVGDDTTRALFATANVNGQPTDEAFRVELDDQEKVREITLFVRPLPGMAEVAASVPPRIARRYGRLPSLYARVLFLPVALVARLADRLVKPLVRRGRKLEGGR